MSLLTILPQITAGCATVEPWAALVIGMIAGILYIAGSDALIKLRLDDAVDAIPVHGVNGIWGLISVGLFTHPERLLQSYGTEAHPGFFYSLSSGGVDARLLACQLVGVLFIFGWAFVTMLPFFLWLNFMGWFRSESVQELVGLDIAYHGGGAPGGGENLMAGPDDEVRDEYLDAYQKYRQNMLEKRGKRGGQDLSTTGEE